MEFSHGGLALWYGTDDAPAPEGTEEARRGASVTIGVQPPNISNTVTVRYRVDGGPTRTVPALLVRTDYADAKQYFRATFPDLWVGDQVEYLPILSCAGRRVPDLGTAITFPSSFRLGAPLNPRGRAVTRPDDSPQSSLQSPQQGRFAVNLEYLCTVNIQLDASPVIIGVTPEGIRVNWSASEGVATGPKLNARLLPGASDWMTIRKDGVGIIDIRATLETYDGALILVNELGVCDFGEKGYQNFLDKNWPSTPSIRSAPRFLTGHPNYLWLNRLQGLGVGEVHMAEFRLVYDLFVAQ